MSVVKKLLLTATFATGSGMILQLHARAAGGLSNESDGIGQQFLQRQRASQARCQQVIPLLHEGDLVFTHVANPLYSKVSQFSGGWSSHVGIAFRKNKSWVVAESHLTGTSYTDFCHFLARTDRGRFAIKRLARDLSTAELTRLRVAANFRIGEPYDFGFNFDSKGRLFCSRFVYEVYREGLGVKIGQVESFRDLIHEYELESGKPAKLGFWKIWFLGKIPWDRRTLTPRSQYEDPQLVSVLDTTREKGLRFLSSL